MFKTLNMFNIVAWQATLAWVPVTVFTRLTLTPSRSRTLRPGCWTSPPATLGVQTVSQSGTNCTLPGQKTSFLAPSGAQGVTICVCLFVLSVLTWLSQSSSLWLRSLLHLSWVFLRSLWAYFVGQTEPKILRLVYMSFESIFRRIIREWRSGDACASEVSNLDKMIRIKSRQNRIN